MINLKFSWKKSLLILFSTGVVFFLLGLFCNLRIVLTAEPLIVANSQELKPAEAIIILGAYVSPEGKLSLVLQDRLDTGLNLYHQGVAPKILLTGDHGQKRYNEVQAMKEYALSKGVPSEDIFMDHAGFDTYDSMYRAQAIFQIKKAVVVTQPFHLARAVYIGHKLGIEIQGFPARIYYPWYYRVVLREWIARSKSFFDTEIWLAQPEFLGEVNPISGNGEMTQD